MMMMMTESLTTEMQNCINATTECHKICLETMTYCMSQGGKYMSANLISAMRDCSEFCMICTNMLISGSLFAGKTCALCAEICDRCALACDNISTDKKMTVCASACRKCTEACQGVKVGV
ncbi:four-helix bundle copper-binding protein [Raphidiopsis sp. BLCC-F218]